MELTHRGFNVVIFVLSAIVLAYIVFPLTTILTFLDPVECFRIVDSAPSMERFRLKPIYCNGFHIDSMRNWDSICLFLGNIF